MGRAQTEGNKILVLRNTVAAGSLPVFFFEQRSPLERIAERFTSSELKDGEGAWWLADRPRDFQ